MMEKETPGLSYVCNDQFVLIEDLNHPLPVPFSSKGLHHPQAWSNSICIDYNAPILCFYEISRDSPNRSVGSLAVSVAKSLYGAVRSLAGWGWNQAETEKRETIPTAKPVRTSFELADHKREGTQIWGSPSGRFIAVSDG